MINIVGLGSSDKDGLTLEAYRIMKNKNKNFIRTKRHEAVKILEEEGIDYESFDYLYESEDSFDKVYEKIVDRLIEENKKGDINYFVPGSPFIAESTVVRLIKATDDYSLTAGVSFIDHLLNAVKTDPSKHMILLDGDDFNIHNVNPRGDIIITQIYNKRIAVDLKLSLSEVYGDEYEIYLVTDAGLKSEKVYKLPIYKLDRMENINHQSALFIPKCNRPVLGDILDSLEDEPIQNNIDIDELIDSTLENLKAIASLNREGLYNYREIFDLIYKKSSKNRLFK
ncbi:SAM-dependent methyltransferase [Peptoniphilus catoniae]|uniref:SAM-dependent methyltransferase n=1 Tax=Peptoniphilus catoniae TaxID=1660341 RepID=UPI0010FD645A|nr:SAM-dependent methyltransferase [Peptoniphilus catoniae]